MKQNISDLTLAELQIKLPLVPTLSQVIDRFQGKLHLMIELKSKPSPQQAEVLKKTLLRLKPIEEFHLMTLDLENFKPLDFIPPKAMVSIARTNVERICKESLRLGLGALTGHYLLLTGKTMGHCRTKNLAIGTGFLDSKNLLYREAARGVDWVFTNKALALSKLLNGNH